MSMDKKNKTDIYHERDRQDVLKKLDGSGPLHGALTKMSNNNTSDIKALLEKNGLKVRFSDKNLNPQKR